MGGHGGGPDFACRRANTEKSVPNERSAEPRILFAGCHGQTGEDGYGDRIGHVAVADSEAPASLRTHSRNAALIGSSAVASGPTR